MTNEQTAVMLLSIKDQIDNAISKLDTNYKKTDTPDPNHFTNGFKEISNLLEKQISNLRLPSTTLLYAKKDY